MLRIEELGLRKTKAGMVQVGFRLPAEAVAYYESEALTSARSKVDVLVDALFFDREMNRRLSAIKPRLEAVAARMGLDLDHNLAEVLAKLVEKGLLQNEQEEGHGSLK